MNLLDQVKQEIKALRECGVTVTAKAEATAIDDIEECEYMSVTDYVDMCIVVAA